MADRLEFDVALDATQAQAQIRQLTTELETGLRAAGQGFSTTLDFSQAIASARVLSDTLTSGLTAASDAFNQSLNFDAAATAAQTISDALVIDPTPIQDINVALGEASVEAASIADAGQIDSTPAATLADELNRGADDATSLAGAVQEASQAAAETSLNARDLAANVAEASTSSGELAQTLGESALAGDRSREAAKGVGDATRGVGDAVKEAGKGHKANNEEMEKGVNIAERLKQKFEEITGRNIEALGPFAKTFESLSEGFGKLGLATEIAGSGLVAGLAAITASGEKVESTLNVITRTTGLTGEALDAAGDSFARVAVQSDRAPQELAKVFSLLEGNTKATGKSLEDLTLSTDQFLKATSGSAGDVRPLTQAAAALGVEAEGIPLLMDQMAAASARFGTSISTLIPAVRQTAPALKSFGFSPGQIVGLNAELESVGLPLRRISNGFVTINKVAQEQGITSSQFFGKMIEDIRHATNETEALTFTRGIFSGTAATQFITAVRDGRISLEKLDEVLADAPGKSKEMAESLTTVGDVLRKFGSILTFSLGREGGGLSIIDSIKETLISLIPAVTHVGDAVSSLSPAFKGFAEGALVPVVVAFRALSELLVPFASLVRKVPDSLKEFIGVFLLFRAAFALEVPQKFIKFFEDSGKAIGKRTKEIIKSFQEEQAATTEGEAGKTAAVEEGTTARLAALQREMAESIAIITQLNQESLAIVEAGEAEKNAATLSGATTRAAITEAGVGGTAALAALKSEEVAAIAAAELEKNTLTAGGAATRGEIRAAEQASAVATLTLGGEEQLASTELAQVEQTAAVGAGAADRGLIRTGETAAAGVNAGIQTAEVAAAPSVAGAAASGAGAGAVGGPVGIAIMAAAAVGLTAFTQTMRNHAKEAKEAKDRQDAFNQSVGDTAITSEDASKRLIDRLSKGDEGKLISNTVRDQLTGAGVSMDEFLTLVKKKVTDKNFNIGESLLSDFVASKGGFQAFAATLGTDISAEVRGRIEEGIKGSNPAAALQAELGNFNVVNALKDFVGGEFTISEDAVNKAADAAAATARERIAKFRAESPENVAILKDLQATRGLTDAKQDLFATEALLGQARAQSILQHAKITDVNEADAAKAAELADAYEKLHIGAGALDQIQRDHVETVVAVTDAMNDGNLSTAEAVHIGLKYGSSIETISAIETKLREEREKGPLTLEAQRNGVVAYNQAIDAGRTPLEAQTEAIRASHLSWDQLTDSVGQAQTAVSDMAPPLKASAGALSAVERGFAEGKTANATFNDAMRAGVGTTQDATLAFKQYKKAVEDGTKVLENFIPKLSDVATNAGIKILPEPAKDAPKPTIGTPFDEASQAIVDLHDERLARLQKQIANAQAFRDQAAAKGFDTTALDATIKDLKGKAAELDATRDKDLKSISDAKKVAAEEPTSLAALMDASTVGLDTALARSTQVLELADQGFKATVAFILDPNNGLTQAQRDKLVNEFSHMTEPEKQAFEQRARERAAKDAEARDLAAKGQKLLTPETNNVFAKDSEDLGVTLGTALVAGLVGGINNPENEGKVFTALSAIVGPELAGRATGRIFGSKAAGAKVPPQPTPSPPGGELVGGAFPTTVPFIFEANPAAVSEAAFRASHGGLNEKEWQAQIDAQRTVDLGSFEATKTGSVAPEPFGPFLDAGTIGAQKASTSLGQNPLKPEDVSKFAAPLAPALSDAATAAAPGVSLAIASQWQANPLPVSAVAGLTVNVPTAADTAGTSGGINFSTGFINGLLDPIVLAAVSSAATNLVTTARSAVDTASHASSPSRLMMKRGQWFVEGLAQGIDDHAYKATHAATRMTDALTGMIGGTMGSPQILAAVTATGPDQVSMGDGPGVDRIVRAISSTREVHPNARRRLPYGGGNG